MTTLRFIDDPEVQEKVEEAAKAAVEVLDELFPGYDAGGITSGFQGSLVEILKSLLAGRMVMYKPLTITATPIRALDSDHFGTRQWLANAFLAAQFQEDGSLKVICADSGRLVPIERAADAFTSFEAAGSSIKEYARKNFDTVEELLEAKFTIVPVVHLTDSETGFALSPIAR